MRLPISMALVTVLGLTSLAAEPLPAPTPLPESPTPPVFGPIRRSTVDETAELPATRDADTYVYIVNGLDPFHWANLKRLAERLRVSGFPNTKFGEYFDMPSFEAEIRKLRARDPYARIALIGYSAGCYPVIASAHRLLNDGIPVALVGYIGGDFLTDTPYNRPPNVTRVVNITGNGFLLSGHNLIWNGTDLQNASNLRLNGVSHFNLPGRPETFRVLYDALLSLSTVR